MTRICIEQTDRYARISIHGHAGYAKAMGLPAGCDIVCAAVSFLGQVAARRILQLAEENMVEVKMFSMQDGSLEMKAIPCAERGRMELDGILRTVRTGGEMLKEAYADFISLSWGLETGAKGGRNMLRNEM